MKIDVKTYTVGSLETKTYLVTSGKEALVIDPGEESKELYLELEKKDIFLRYILLTHGHFDHVLGLDRIKALFPDADIVIGEDDVELIKNIPAQGVFVGQKLSGVKSEPFPVADGAILPLGETSIKVISTPGHTKGSVCYLIADHLFSGDTLFYHTYGRIDLPYSEPGEMKNSLFKLFLLPEETLVLPGHGRPTTIGEEKEFSA